MAAVSALIVACGITGRIGLLEAIVRVESRGDPSALAVNGSVELVRPPRNRDEAVTMARWLGAHGYNFDAGLAQVNSANLARFGLDAASVFEPCANLRAATEILGACRERAQARGLAGATAVAAALSCYNTGDLSRGIRNGYAAAVRAAVSRSSARRGAARIDAASYPNGSRRPDVFALASPEAFAARRSEERVR